MNSEKRLIIAFTLSLGILFLFQTFFVPPPSKTPQKTTQNVDITKEQTMVSEEKNLPPAEETLTEVETDEYILTICNPGGYVKNVSFKKYEDSQEFSNLFVTPAVKDKDFDIQISSKSIRLSTKDGFYKQINLKGDYLLQLETNVSGEISILSGEVFNNMDGRYQEIVYKSGGDIQHSSISKIRKNPISLTEGLIGLRNRYFTAAVILPDKERFVASIVDKYVDISLNTNKLKTNIELYLGPEKTSILKKHDLQGLVKYGFFHPIAIFLLKILTLLFALFHNWGLAIIALSALIYLAFSPLTKKSAQSFKKMQELQPQMEALKVKYKTDSQRLNQEIMKLYSENKLNPLGGCLPLFIQLPIFFALYPILMRFIEIKGASFLWIKDLSKPDTLSFLGAVGDKIHVLPVLMAGLMFFQQKLNSSKSAINPEQQKMMTLFFPIFFGVIFYSFPAGLVLYWFTNSLFSTAYQYKISKQK